MEVIKNLRYINPFKTSVLTMGSYDGIHLGHKKILDEVVKYSSYFKVPSVVITFHPHPREVLVQKDTPFSLIMSLEQKLKIIKSIGVDFVYIINFTEKFSKISADNFIKENVVKNFNPSCIIIGYNHHFGKGRTGSANYLKKFCDEKSIELKIIKPILYENNKVSSSIIRENILSGRIQKSNSLLGSLFCIEAKVCSGSGRGKKLKFPTANVKPIHENQILPGIGVYFVKARIIGLSAYGMCNFGIRPTFNEKKLVMEIHLFHDKIDNLNGIEIKVEFLEKIRDEIKFRSSEKLVEQLNHDKQVCLELMAKYE